MTNINDEKYPQEQQRDVKDEGGIPIIRNVSNQMDQTQQHGDQVHPTLFGQSQFKGGFGPVNTIPSIPWQDGGGTGLESVQWQHGQGQGSGNSQWQQWSNHSQLITPCCLCYPVGYRYYW